MGDREPQHGHDGHHHEDSPISPRSFVGNLTGTGQPWYRVLRQVVTNFGIKAVTLRSCCGNHGQPGC